MPRKKIIFVIVEGLSDEEAFGVILSRFYNCKAVYIHVMHCDITSEKGVNSSNIVAKIGGIVKNYAGKHLNLGILAKLCILLIWMELLFPMMR